MERVAKDHRVSSPDSAIGLRVREVLGVSTLAGARVLAGAGGLDRVVRRLNVMEVPDILPWVKPHELLLTTGYPLRHRPEALVDLVAALDERGLAAMAIKLNRYLDALPAPVLAEADRRDFPLIEFPDGVGFDDVLNQVLSELLNRQAAVLARSEAAHRALVSVVLEGGGLDDLAAELARILGGPIMITTPDGRLLAGAAHGSRTGATGGAARTEVPIVAARVDHGRIVAFSPEPLADADIHVLERAATVAALAITKRLAVAAVESKYRADFLRDVLTGRAENLAAAVTHARTLGWEIDRPLVALVAVPDRDGAPASPVPERFVSAWTGALRLRDPSAPVVSFNDEVVALVGAPRDGDTDRLGADLQRQIKADGRYSLGLSRVAGAPEQLPQAYEQARTAVRIGRRRSGPGARTSFDRLGVHRLLALIPDGDELRDFVAEVLGDLAGPTPEATDLRHTLEVLLDTNNNVAESARRLHFHYNTMRYRIYKLEKMLGPFTSTPALRLDLALALRILELRPA